MEAPMAFDWNIKEVVDGDVRAPDGTTMTVYYVLTGCHCLGVWAGDALTGAFVGWSRMCYAHESFKLLARVWHSLN